ncbi:hypothetical protein ES703_111086 [subsurface metagenome]
MDENKTVIQQDKKVDETRDARGRFTNGHPNTKPKGTTHKFTDLKKAFLEAFEKTGGVDGLVEWIEKNPKTRGQFYTLIARMLPSNLDLTLPQDTIIKVISAVPRPEPEEKK